MFITLTQSYVFNKIFQNKIKSNLRPINSLLVDNTISNENELSFSGSGLYNIFHEYFLLNDPNRINEIPELLKQYKNKEIQLFNELELKYGKKVIESDIEILRNTTSYNNNNLFPWFDTWYPVLFTRFTDKTKPHSISLLGQPYVLFYNHIDKLWKITDDTCPHRLVPLSEGRIDENGNIECPYHGWTFDGSTGECLKIPQSTKPINQELCSINTYPCVERQGLLFMYPRPISQVGLLPKEDTIPLCEPLNDPDVVYLDVSRDLPYDFTTLLENILDPSHVAYTHHGTIGNRNWASEVPLVVKGSPTLNGFNGTYQYVPLSGPLTKNSSTSKVERESVFKAPSYVHHSISRDDLQSWTVVYGVPTAPGRSKIIGRFPFKFKTKSLASNIQKFVFKYIPSWMQHMQQNRVLDDDNIFLTLQEERIRTMGAEWRDYVLPTRADLFVAQFRRWIENFGHPFIKNDINTKPAVNRRKLQAKYSESDPLKNRLDLLDRYSQHTLQCKPCLDALNFVRLAKKVIITVAFLSSPLIRLFLFLARKIGNYNLIYSYLSGLLKQTMTISILGSATFSLLSAFLWWQLDGIESNLVRGAWPPPRNKILDIRKKKTT